MKHNEDRDLLKDAPTFTLPPPPRFDAAASAVAQPVEPLGKKRTQLGLPLKPKFSRLINRRSKFLALMAIVGFATGAAGGILVVQRDKQQRLENSASMIQIPTEQTSAFHSAAPALENNDASLEVSEPVENQVRVRPNQRRARKQPTRELVVLSDTDEDEDEDLEWDKDNDDEAEKDKNDDERKKNRDRERNRKDRERDADSRRSDRTRAILSDAMRVRKP